MQLDPIVRPNWTVFASLLERLPGEAKSGKAEDRRGAGEARLGCERSQKGRGEATEAGGGGKLCGSGGYREKCDKHPPSSVLAELLFMLISMNKDREDVSRRSGQGAPNMNVARQVD